VCAVYDSPSPLAEPLEIIPCASEYEAQRAKSWVLKQVGLTLGSPGYLQGVYAEQKNDVFKEGT
jgi:hypothetical protein